MTATTTDVRAWLREQGEDVGVKGAIPKHLRAKFDQAHTDGPEPPPLEGQMTLAGEADYDTGVTEADFPPDDTAPDAAADTGERKPRSVRASKKAQASSFRNKLWGGGKAKRPAKKHPRVSLKGFAEDLFLDLAWTFQGAPPMEKILYLQAPLAGQIVEDTARGTVADAVLQPVARIDRQFKALEALTAPAWVAGIMMKGARDDDGNYSPGTQFMFGGLRHALLSMTRVADLDFEQLKTKSQELKGKSDQIDQIIGWLFEMPSPEPDLTADQAQEMAGQAA